jgi:hypothetical protein
MKTLDTPFPSKMGVSHGQIAFGQTITAPGFEVPSFLCSSEAVLQGWRLCTSMWV